MSFLKATIELGDSITNWKMQSSDATKINIKRMKRLLKYRNLLWVLLMVASSGNFLHAQDMEEKAIEANYSFDTETNKSSIETNGDLNKKDVKKARKQVRKEEREKRRQERRAKWQESNGDYRGNSEYYYPYYPYSYRSSYFHGYRYAYPYRYGSSYGYQHYYGRHYYGRNYHGRY